MPSGFVEVSGYSQTDLDAAYQRGVVDGGSAVKGNATQAQVLQGYTFSSASVGSNKSGTMVNRGSVSQQLNPGSSFSGASGYYSNISIQAKANTQDHVMDNQYEDLGANNLVRWVDARTVCNNAKNVGYSQGVSAGFDKYVQNVARSYYTMGYEYPQVGESVNIWSGKSVAANSIIILYVSAMASHSSDTPTVTPTCVATSGDVELISAINTTYSNAAIDSAHVDSILWGFVYKVPVASVLQLSFLLPNKRARLEYNVVLLSSSTS